jgi:hypothetical protein
MFGTITDFDRAQRAVDGLDGAPIMAFSERTIIVSDILSMGFIRTLSLE